MLFDIDPFIAGQEGGKQYNVFIKGNLAQLRRYCPNSCSHNQLKMVAEPS